MLSGSGKTHQGGSRVVAQALEAQRVDAVGLLAQDAGAVSIQGMRALVVDDLPEALSVVEERLRMMGLEVDAESSGMLRPPIALRKVITYGPPLMPLT